MSMILCGGVLEVANMGSREEVGLCERLWERERLAILAWAALGGLGFLYWVCWIVTDRKGAGLDAGQGAVVASGSGGGLEREAE